MAFLLPALTFGTILSSVLTITGHYAGPGRAWLVYVCKPLTTLLILCIALLPGTFLTSNYTRLIAIGLVFSLMGDICLVLPQDRFLHGLASFLVAQVCYAWAFAAGASVRGFVWIALAVALVGVAVLRYLWPGLPGRMRPAVIVYIAAILTMAALAVGRALEMATPMRLAAAAGALLFVVSDATLAINRFRQPFRLAQAVVLATYFAAQLLIALSTLQR